MDFHGIEIVCPACKRELHDRADGETLTCVGCGREYPVILGIPDLRLLADPYISIDADRAKGRLLAEKCAGLTFERALDAYYAMTPAVPPVQARLFKRSVLAAEARAHEALDTWESGADDSRAGTLLEIGCGTGPMLLAARERTNRVVGIDIAFRWLVMGRIRLDEAGAKDVPLLCACAEALPFPAERFDRIIADSVIEHLQDSAAALGEARRVCRPGARFYLTTPNRFSLGPDPHSGLPAGGWLPESWTAAYVQRRGGIPPRRHLFSYGELQRALRNAGFADVDVYLPDVPAAQRAGLGGGGRAAVDAYHFVKRLPLARQALRRIGPLLSARAIAASDRSPSSSPHAASITN